MQTKFNNVRADQSTIYKIQIVQFLILTFTVILIDHILCNGYKGEDGKKATV